jgi:hypothetical protein
VARFMGKVERADGTSVDIPAETCPRCRGIGYLTGPITYQSRLRGDSRRAKSGDVCPLCVGLGWVGLTGKWQEG